MGIPEETYFEALDNEEYYEELDDSSRRPNLYQRQFPWLEEQRGIEESDETDDEDVQGLTDEYRHDILNNKIRVMDTNLKLIDAYDYFESGIAEKLEKCDTAKERAYTLTNVKNYILYAFHFGYFEVQGDQPRLLMKIFEILNDRGVELKKIDIIRTRIVGRFRGEPNDDDYIGKWESVVEEFGKPEIVNDFLRTYFVVAGDVTARGDTKNRLLEAFSETDDDDKILSPRMGSVGEAQEFLNNLVTYAEYYHHLTEPENYGIDLGEEGDNDIEAECNRIISRLSKAGTSIWEPLVLAVYHDVREGAVGRQTLLRDLLRDIESMALRSFAAMDTNVRDSAYASAIKEYHDNGLNGDIQDELTDIESDDPSAFGEDLVVAMYQADWRRGWGKTTLRKICSENLGGDDRMVLRELNMDDTLVHLEHTFPRSPPTDGSDDYVWLSNFSQTGPIEEEANSDDEDTESDSEVSGDETPETVPAVVRALVESGNEDDLEEVSEEYIHDIGNLLLLRSRENIQIGNNPFGDKLVRYCLTDGFCELRSNQHICETTMEEPDFDDIERYANVTDTLDNIKDSNWEEYIDEAEANVGSRNELEEELEEELDRLSSSIEQFHSFWNYDEVTTHRADLVEALCDSIAFQSDEFDDVNFEELSEEETERRNDVIAANMKRRT